MASTLDPRSERRPGGDSFHREGLAQGWTDTWATLRQALEDRSTTIAVFSTATLLSLISVLDHLARGELDIDFRSFYFAWRAVQGGGDVYDVAHLNELAEQQWAFHNHVWPYIYPPFLAYVLSPIASITFPKALVGWALASVVAMGLALTALMSSLTVPADRGEGGRQVPLQQAVLLCALLICLLPLRANITHGQVNLFVLAFLALSLRALVRGDDVTCGLWLAPAILIKLTPGVLVIGLLARRRYRAVVACAAAGLLLAAITLPLGAWPAWKTYLTQLPRLSHGSPIQGLFDPAIVWNFSPAGTFSRWLPRSREIVTALCAGLSAALLALAALSARRSQRQEDDARALAPFFPLMLLVSPLVYTHHLIYLAPAAAVWIDRAWHERRPWVLIAATSLLLAAGAEIPAIYARLSLPWTALRMVTSMNLYALVALFCLGLHMVRRPHPPAAAEPSPAR